MHWPITPIKLWHASSLVVILLLSGCQPNLFMEEQGPQGPTGTLEKCHIVKKGETLPGIAKRNGHKKEDLAKWNNIPYPYMLTPDDTGRCLRIDDPSDDGIATPPAPDIPVETSTPPASTPVTTKPSSPDSDTPSPEPACAEAEGFYLVQTGESLLSIANRYEQTWQDVVAWNKIDPPYHLNEGQCLRVSPPELPTNELPPLEPTQPILSPDEGSRDYHIVLPGDTLYSLAKHYDVSVGDLMAWNDLQSENLPLGQELRIRPPPDVDIVLPKLPSPNFADDEMIDDEIVDGGTIDEMIDDNPFIEVRPSRHVVEPGETLESIAKKYGVSRSDLAKWNGIGPPYTVWPTLELTLFPSP